MYKRINSILILLSWLLISLLLITVGAFGKDGSNRLILEDYPSLDLAAETSGGRGSGGVLEGGGVGGSRGDGQSFSKKEEKNQRRDFDGHFDSETRNFGHLDLEKSNGRYGRKRKKIDKKKERQDKREERRKNRLEQQKELDQQFQQKHQQQKEQIKQQQQQHYFDGSPSSILDSDGGKIHPYFVPHFGAALENPKNQVSNSDWLQRNITSIWYTLQHIQKGMKQMRRMFRINSGMNHHKNSKRFQNSHSSSISTEEPCDPEWEIDPNSCYDKNGVTCNSKGMCSCGQCICDPSYYGSHCQCNDMECQRYDGMLCGGSARGQCRCGACICRPGYSGNSCECSLSTLECQKSNGEICSGKGKCVCNRCHCDESYAGKFCEESIYSAGICERLKPCVLCMVFGKKYPKCEDCNIKVEMVDELESSRATCYMINLGCILKYSYIAPTTEAAAMTVLIKKDRSCLNHMENGGEKITSKELV